MYKTQIALKQPWKKNYHWCFLVLLIATLTAVEFFFFPVRIYSTGKNLEHSKMFLFGEVEKLPLDLILPSIIVHIIYSIRDERAELHLKCLSRNQIVLNKKKDLGEGFTANYFSSPPKSEGLGFSLLEMWISQKFCCTFSF